MSKTVTIGTKPKVPRASADDWVMNRPELASPAEAALPSPADGAGLDTEPMKRLTIDIPADLHARMKSQCALRGVKMADEVRALLQRHFPAAEG